MFKHIGYHRWSIHQVANQCWATVVGGFQHVFPYSCDGSFGWLIFLIRGWNQQPDMMYVYVCTCTCKTVIFTIACDCQACFVAVLDVEDGELGFWHWTWNSGNTWKRGTQFTAQKPGSL